MKLNDKSCSCIAGKGICNHIVAMLYTIAHFKAAGHKVVPPVITCTSLTQKWHVPSRTRGITPQPVKSMKVQSPADKDQKFKRSKSKSNNQSESGEPSVKRTTVECVKPKLYNPIRQDLCETAVSIADGLRNNLCDLTDKLQLFKVMPTDITSLGQIDCTFGPVYIGSTLANQNQISEETDITPNKEILECPPFNLPELSSNFARVLSEEEHEILEGFSVTVDLSRDYERLTREQSLSADWKRLRKYRFTASKHFKQISSRRKDHDKLAESILIEKHIQTASMLFGLQHENEAAKVYSRTTGNNVYNVGMVINPTASYLGCSPDRRVFDNTENEFGLLEIKCPQATSFVEMPYLQQSDDSFHLKSTHMYYHQIQGQMGITGSKWCDLIIYCEDDIHVERIKFDSDFFQKIKDKVDMFYFNYFLPLIVRSKSEQTKSLAN